MNTFVRDGIFNHLAIEEKLLVKKICSQWNNYLEHKIILNDVFTNEKKTMRAINEFMMQHTDLEYYKTEIYIMNGMIKYFYNKVFKIYTPTTQRKYIYKRVCCSGLKSLVNVCLVLDYKINKPMNDENNDELVNHGLYFASLSQNIGLVEYMLKIGATNYNFGLKAGCLSKNKYLIKKMIELGATMCYACHKDIREHMLINKINQ